MEESNLSDIDAGKLYSAIQSGQLIKELIESDVRLLENFQIVDYVTPRP